MSINFNICMFGGPVFMTELRDSRMLANILPLNCVPTPVFNYLKTFFKIIYDTEFSVCQYFYSLILCVHDLHTWILVGFDSTYI